MTPQEALKVIDKVHDYPCPYGIGGTAWIYIRNCIEKHMPKKPIRANRIIRKDGSLFLNDDNEYWKCPICTKYDVPLLKNQECCHCCGQALDWSDTE